MRKFSISCSHFLPLSSILVAKVDFNCFTICLNLSWSVFEIMLTHFKPGKRSHYLDNPFPFSEFSSFFDHLKYGSPEFWFLVCLPLVLYLSFNFIRGCFKSWKGFNMKRFLVLKNAFSIFCFCLMNCWILCGMFEFGLIFLW